MIAYTLPMECLSGAARADRLGMSPLGGGVLMRTAMLVLVATSTLIACDSPTPREASSAPAVVAQPVWQRQSITFYLPHRIIGERLPASTLADYISALGVEAEQAFAAQESAWGVSGMIVVIVQPGGRSRVWIVTGEPALEAPIVGAIVDRLEAVSAPDVADGPVPIGIEFKFKGGGALPEGMPMPLPASWRALIPPDGALMDDALVNRAWAEG